MTNGSGFSRFSFIFSQTCIAYIPETKPFKRNPSDKFCGINSCSKRVKFRKKLVQLFLRKNGYRQTERQKDRQKDRKTDRKTPDNDEYTRHLDDVGMTNNAPI